MKAFFRESRRKIHFFKTVNPDFPAHLHEEIELLYVKDGCCTAFADGKEYTVKKNKFFISFPNQVHSYKNSKKGEYLCVVVKPSQLYHYASSFGDLLPLNAVIPLTENGDEEYLFYEAFNEYNQNGENSIVICYLTLLFGKLLKQCELKKSDVSQDSISSILTYCANHYKENISVEDISNALHISRSHISRLFSSRIRMNFCDYINSLRLVDAANMLGNENASITEIAYASGFSTLRTFNRAFLKYYGVTPSQYKCIKKQVTLKADVSSHVLLALSAT